MSETLLRVLQKQQGMPRVLQLLRLRQQKRQQTPRPGNDQNVQKSQRPDSLPGNLQRLLAKSDLQM